MLAEQSGSQGGRFAGGGRFRMLRRRPGAQSSSSDTTSPVSGNTYRGCFRILWQRGHWVFGCPGVQNPDSGFAKLFSCCRSPEGRPALG
jgi:hypothetical protein